MIEERLAEIRNEFASLDDSFTQYSFLVELSAYVSPDQPDLMKEEHLQRGCHSRVWIRQSIENGVFHMDATSDTMLIRGVLMS